MNVIICFLLITNIVDVVVVNAEEHHEHHHDEKKPLYFVPSLKDAAHVADLLFAQAHFT